MLAVADEAGAAAERAVREFGDDPAVRRVCHAVVPVAPATAAAARLGDEEHRWGSSGSRPRRRRWPRRPAQATGWPDARAEADRPRGPTPGSPPRCSTASARSARAGPAAGAVGEGGTRAELVGALVRYSGLGAAGADRVAVPQPVRRAARPLRAGRAGRADAGDPAARRRPPAVLPAGTGSGRVRTSCASRSSSGVALRRGAPSRRAAVPRPNASWAPTVTSRAPASAWAPTRRPSRCGPWRTRRRPAGGRSRLTRWCRRGSG